MLGVLNENDPASSDFELWTATPESSGYCTSGHRSYFWRKKAAAQCYVGKDYEIPTAKRVDCDCTERDYDWYVV